MGEKSGFLLVCVFVCFYIIFGEEATRLDGGHDRSGKWVELGSMK